MLLSNAGVLDVRDSDVLISQDPMGPSTVYSATGARLVRKSHQRIFLSSAAVIRMFVSVGDQTTDLIVAVCMFGPIS